MQDETNFQLTKEKKNSDRKESRVKKIKRGGFSALLTIIVISCVIAVNLIIKISLERFDVKIDLTENMIYSIESSTEEYLTSFDKNIKFIITSPEDSFKASGSGMYYAQMNEIAKLFSLKGKNIELEYIDLVKNPSFSGEYGGNITTYNLIVESIDTGRFKVLTPDEYLDIKYYLDDGSEISVQEAQTHAAFGRQVSQDISAASEQAILSALMYVTDLSPVKVGFLTGYGEGELAGGGIVYTAFKDLLEKNSYATEVIDLNLAAEIDESFDFIISFAPKADYTTDIMRSIDIWLDNNGNHGKTLIYVSDLEFPTQPNLGGYFAEWGITVDDSYVYQTDSNYAGSNNAQQYLAVGNSDLSNGFENARFIANLSRSITLNFESDANFTTSSLLTSYDGAIKIPFDATSDFDISGLPTGILNIAVESKKARYDAEGSYESRIMVFASPYLFDEYFLNAKQISHAEYFINMFNKISGKEQNVSLTEKKFSLPILNIPAGKAYLIGAVFSIVLPLGVLAAGITVWLRRRRL